MVIFQGFLFKEGSVVQQSKVFKSISKSFFERSKDTGRRRGEGKRMKGSAGEKKQSLPRGWSMGKVEGKRLNGSAGNRRKICRKDGGAGWMVGVLGEMWHSVGGSTGIF